MALVLFTFTTTEYSSAQRVQGSSLAQFHIPQMEATTAGLQVETSLDGVAYVAVQSADCRGGAAAIVTIPASAAGATVIQPPLGFLDGSQWVRLRAVTAVPAAVAQNNQVVKAVALEARY